MEARERQFLQTKQKLDELRISDCFPIECTELVSKLLTMTTNANTPGYQCHNKPNQYEHSNSRIIDLEMRVKIETFRPRQWAQSYRRQSTRTIICIFRTSTSKRRMRCWRKGSTCWKVSRSTLWKRKKWRR